MIDGPSLFLGWRFSVLRWWSIPQAILTSRMPASLLLVQRVSNLTANYRTVLLRLHSKLLGQSKRSLKTEDTIFTVAVQSQRQSPNLWHALATNGGGLTMAGDFRGGTSPFAHAANELLHLKSV